MQEMNIHIHNIRSSQVQIAQSNPHERITPPALRKKTRMTSFDISENTTRKRRFHTETRTSNRKRLL